MDDVHLNAEVGSGVWPVAAVIHTATANRPDLWKFTLVSRGSTPPTPGMVVTFAPVGAQPVARLTVLTAPASIPGGAFRVTATRLPAGDLAAAVSPLIRGQANEILSRLTDRWCEISITADAALQRVSVHSLRRSGWLTTGGESVGQCIRWLLRHLAAERGVVLRMKVDSIGAISLIDPFSDSSTTADPVAEVRRIVHGRSDPFNARPGRLSGHQVWVRGRGDDQGWDDIWTEWLKAAAVVGDQQSAVRQFRAKWHAAGTTHGRDGKVVQHDGAVQFRRLWEDRASYIERFRRTVRPSAWMAVAKMAGAVHENGQLWVKVVPLTWFAGRDGLEPCCPDQELMCRLAAPYAGAGGVDSAKSDHGLWTVPSKGARVWIAAPSAFHDPVVLGDVRLFAPKADVFGLYLLPDQTWATAVGKFVVTADSTFDPP